MSAIYTYLTFSGNCRQAMIFYQQCLGGELVFQTVGESFLAKKLPRTMHDLILHSTLSNGKLLMMASDMVSEPGLIPGNAISLVFNCNSEEELKTCYEKLSMGGEATHEIAQNFSGAFFGGLTDRFGNHWLLNFNEVKEQ